jgi:transketolase
MAVGVALALRAKGLSDSRVVVLCGDAELNEGSNWEAILHAGSAKLANLTLIVVDNRSSSVSMGDIAERLRAFGWDAVTVDGRDHEQLRAAYEHRADVPTAVVARV